MRDVWMEEVGCDISTHPAIISRPRAYSPAEEGNLMHWYDFPRLISTLADGDPITSATNLGSAGGSATQSGTARPTFKANIQNGLGVARFDGVNDYLVLPAEFSGITYTIYVAYMPATLGDYVVGFGGSQVDSARNFFMVNSTTQRQWIFGSVRDVTIASTVNTWYYDAARRASNTFCGSSRNGTESSAGAIAPGSITRFDRIGSAYSGFLASGDLGEAMLFSESHDAAKMARINAYLQKKWGI